MENSKVEYKNSEKFKDKNCDWGKEIVGFANRDGGRLIIGINDDGSYQGFNFLNSFSADGKNGFDKLKEKIEQYCKDRISPPLLCDINYCKNEYGETVEVNVPKRKTMPYAILDGVKRTYYIRTTHGVVPVTDPSLIAWLYNDSKDILSENIRLEISRIKNELSFIIDHDNNGLTYVRGLWGYVSFFEHMYELKLTEDDIIVLYDFLLPYAILIKLNERINFSWNTDFKEYPGVSYLTYTESKSTNYDIKDILISNLHKLTNINHKTQIEELLKSVKLSFNSRLMLPMNTDLSVIHDTDNSSKIVISNNQFSIDIDCNRVMWSAGLMNSVYYGSIVNIYGFDLQDEFINRYSTSTYNINTKIAYQFPENGLYEFDIIHKFCNSIIKIVSDNFDSSKCSYEHQTRSKIYSADIMLKLILEKLEIKIR